MRPRFRNQPNQVLACNKRDTDNERCSGFETSTAQTGDVESIHRARGLEPERLAMNPMSLLTLSPESLQAAVAHAGSCSPHGERRERHYALALALSLLLVPTSLLLLI